MTDASGAVVETTGYMPSGEQREHTGIAATNYKFTGQELDPESGLYYYRARYYDSTIGRFISSDTIVPEPFNPQSLNRYSYVLNSPVNYIDPTGHYSECWTDAQGVWHCEFYNDDGGGGGGGSDDDYCRIWGCGGSEPPPGRGGGGGKGGKGGNGGNGGGGNSGGGKKQKTPVTYRGFNVNGIDLTGSGSGNSSVRYAYGQLLYNSLHWAPFNFQFERPHWKCNEFLYSALGGSSSGFPTVLRNKGKYYDHYVPLIEDLADPDFAENQLYYGNLEERQYGDMMIWYSEALNVHHGGLYVGNDRVVHASMWGLRMNTIDYINERYRYKVTPIIRRLKN